MDAGSFVEFDALAVHRSTAFGMEKKKPLGDGLEAGQQPRQDRVELGGGLVGRAPQLPAQDGDLPLPLGAQKDPAHVGGVAGIVLGGEAR